VESLTVVEINPGYPELIARHANVSSLLSNPKVEIVIDDGRRWLNRHPGETFDAIIMNTTWHWRAHCTNLLSQEFLLLMRSHLNSGGVALYNTTGSPEVQRTACVVFPHVVRVINNVVVSDTPLMPNRSRWRETLLAWTIDGRPVVDAGTPEGNDALESALALVDSMTSDPLAFRAMEPRSSILARTEGARIVTDDNMGTEWDLAGR
jgi:spermidine synthase